MTDKTNVKTLEEADAASFLKEMREFAITINEECPEGHRRDPSSGACLPIGSTDHTAFTRSQNNDDGPEWRGEVTKPNNTPLMTMDQAETAVDAEEMDEPESCTEGTTFSFIQRRCVTTDEAEKENSEDFARDESGEEILEDAAAPGSGGHREITLMQPEGRRDPVNHDCPANEIFNYARRECIPLNKDTVMASEIFAHFDEKTQEEIATGFARLALTSPDPMDGHRHVATLDMEGNGVTSVAGFMHLHSHEVSKFNIKPRTGQKENGEDYTSQHPGVAVPVEMRLEKLEDADSTEEAAPLKGGQRKALSDSAFGVPGKRKFPLDTCARVRNAMARFNQAKGLTSSEVATLRRKILARAKACSIEVTNFAKATTESEFTEVVSELVREELGNIHERLEAYRAASQQGPCPPGMVWNSSDNRCGHTRGLVEEVSQHVDIVKHQPDGRRDTIGFQCPDGEFFDFTNRRCLPLDPSNKPGTTTTKADHEDSQSRKLVPNPEGRPAKLPQDCPAGTIWDKLLERCLPLDSRKKTKSEEEDAAIPPQFLKNIKKKKGKNGDDKKGGLPDFLKKKKSKSEEEDVAAKHGQVTPNGPGNKGGPGCPEGQFMNPVTKKCMPRKGAFKGKSETESAENAQPGNREGLTSDPEGRVKLPSDCPPGTAWNAVRRVCSPLSSMDKNRPSGSPGPMSSQDMAFVVENMSDAQLIKELDEIIADEDTSALARSKFKVLAKELNNAAFPPSLVSTTRRSLMHHVPDVEDPYDTATVDVSRLRNALFKVKTVEWFSDKAVEDAREHLLFHARAIVAEKLALKKI